VRFVVAGEEHASGAAVLLVHGFGGCAEHWRKNTTALAAAGFRVYAIDLLGFGFSAKPDPNAGLGPDAPPNGVYNFQNWGDQLADFAAEVCGGPVFIAANSVGAIAALQAAVDSPSLTRAVCLLNMSLRGLHFSKQPQPLRPLLRAFQTTLRTSSLGAAFFASVATPSSVRSVLREAYGDRSAVTEELVEAILAPGRQPGAAAVFLDFISNSSGPLGEELLKRVACPVLTVWGAADPWESVALARPLYSPEANPGVVSAFIELPGVGHCPQDEAPHLVNPLLVDWLLSHGAERSSL